MFEVDPIWMIRELREHVAENANLIEVLSSTYLDRVRVDEAGNIAAISQYPFGTIVTLKSSDPAFIQETIRSADNIDSVIVQSNKAKDVVIDMGFHIQSKSIGYTVKRNTFRSINDCPNYIVRPATEQDFPQIEKFSLGEKDNECSVERYIPSYSVGDETTFYVAKRDSSILGYLLTTHLIEGVVDISYIHVAQNRRRQGIGKRLISSATSNLLNRELVPIYDVAYNNISSQKTCESVGYYVCGTRWSLGTGGE